MSIANDIAAQTEQRLAEIDVAQRHRLARLLRRYSHWTANLHHIGQFRMSSDGIAIEMARNETRGASGTVLCGFPDLDVAKWVQAATFQSWPLVSDCDDVNRFVRLSSTTERFTA